MANADSLNYPLKFYARFHQFPGDDTGNFYFLCQNPMDQKRKQSDYCNSMGLLLTLCYQLQVQWISTSPGRGVYLLIVLRNPDSFPISDKLYVVNASRVGKSIVLSLR